MTATELKEARLKLGMTQVQFAKALRCTQQNISQAEGGKFTISERMATKVQKLLNNHHAKTN